MKKTALLILALVLAFSVSGCSENKAEIGNEPVNITMLKGSTGIGAVKLMEESEKNETDGNYNINVSAAADDAMAKIISGEVDIAAVPTNIAPLIYNKTNGNIAVLAVNTLGVLYIVENGDSIHTIKDLEGKTIYSSGQGAVPEYVLNYLLEKNNVENVNIVYMTEHAEVAAALADGRADIALLPEPNVTAVMMKNSQTRIAVDVNDEWKKTNGSELAMGCIIAGKEFVDENEEAVDTFLKEYSESIDYVNNNVSEAAELVEKYGIMASSDAAVKAIPNCNIVYKEKDEMKTMLEAFYDVLYKANPKSVGGEIPDTELYYD
ncbi:MAG: ABC transporter substrate-binding protein [Clostridiales bacterium]|nr:ABC transporter substrate-binding protein [Clostridiales bacterium]